MQNGDNNMDGFGEVDCSQMVRGGGGFYCNLITEILLLFFPVMADSTILGYGYCFVDERCQYSV